MMGDWGWLASIGTGWWVVVIALIVLGALVLWIAWIILPFAVFGLKERLKQLIEKHDSMVKKYEKTIESQQEIITRLEWIIYATNKDIYKEFQDRLKTTKNEGDVQT